MQGRGVEGFVVSHGRQNAGQTSGEHALAGARFALDQYRGTNCASGIREFERAMHFGV